MVKSAKETAMDQDNPVFEIDYPSRKFRLKIVLANIDKGTTFGDLHAEGDIGTLQMSREVADDFDCDHPDKYVEAIVTKVDEVAGKLSKGQHETLYEQLYEWLCGRRKAVLTEDWKMEGRELEDFG
jgi:hypothetical protein